VVCICLSDVARRKSHWFWDILEIFSSLFFFLLVTVFLMAMISVVLAMISVVLAMISVVFDIA